MAHQIPWLRIIAEGVAIVISILLAFGIQAWWETSRDRADEQAILAGLQRDITTNLAELGNVIDVHLNHQELLTQLDTMSPTQAQALPRDSAGMYTVALSMAYTFESQDGTLEGVLASGTLQLIEDASLREGLVAWRRQMVDLEEEADALRRVSERATARIAALGGPYSHGSTPIATHPELRDAFLRLPSPDLPALVNDDELRAIARQKRLVALIYLMPLLQLQTHAASTLSLVRQLGSAF